MRKALSVIVLVCAAFFAQHTLAARAATGPVRNIYASCTSVRFVIHGQPGQYQLRVVATGTAATATRLSGDTTTAVNFLHAPSHVRAQVIVGTSVVAQRLLEC